MADGGANRSEDEVGRQARQQRFHRLVDGGMARRRGIRWFIQDRVVGIEFGDGFACRRAASRSPNTRARFACIRPS